MYHFYKNNPFNFYDQKYSICKNILLFHKDPKKKKWQINGLNNLLKGEHFFKLYGLNNIV